MSSMIRLYDRNEGEYISVAEVIKHLREHPRPEGMVQPLLLWGSAGVGKCLEGSVEVVVNDKSVPIEQVWETYAGEAESDGEGEWAVPLEELLVPAVGADGQGLLELRRVTHLYRQRVREWGRRVRLEDGSEITMTRRHRLLGLDGWTNRFAVGDRIAIPDSQEELLRMQAAVEPEARGGTALMTAPARAVAVGWSSIALVEDVWLDCYVYDLEVEEAHNYVAGGVISHNTARVMSYCTQLGLAMKIYLPAQDESGADIVGERIADSVSGKTERLLPVWLPDAVRDGPDGVLFIDEINRAPKSVRDGMLELVGDGTILQVDYRLPPGWSIVAAANPADLTHDVYDIDDAMVDRFVHMAPGYDPAVWASWAGQQPTMHQSVVDYALAHPDEVDQGEAGFPLALASRILATPRAWANLGFLLDDDTPEGMRMVLSVGMIGREKAESYLGYWEAWKKGYRPLTFEQIINREYERIIPSWGSGTEAGGMVEASNERIVAALMQQPADEKVTLIVSRYLASIPPEFAERFFDSGARTIPTWIGPLREKLDQWRARMSGGPDARSR